MGDSFYPAGQGMKTACGNCGSKTGCGCSTPNPYEGIWHDPTSYNVSKHGPAFFPKLASAQKAEVRSFLKQAGDFDAGPVDLLATPLATLLSFMRALAHIHQTHHWQTSGPAFLADHKLFEQLYSESLESIDKMAERAVGSDGPRVVDPFVQARGVATIVAHICGHEANDSLPSSLEALSPDLMVQRSLRGETTFLLIVSKMIDELQATGRLTPGTSNLLEDVADKHETFVYLLQQRGTTFMYSYDRS